jgi:hypothetical protein
MPFRHWSAAAFAALSVSAGIANAAPEQQPAVWQLHHAQFDYFGITTRFTCDGLEHKVRQILLYLGARDDAYVQATGCPGGPSSISRSAWVRADFSTLAAPAAASDPTDAATASWTALDLAAQQPFFLGDGDCELIDQMKKLVTDNFSWRGKVSYRADCPINTTQFHDFRIQGEVLKLNAPPAH